MRKIVFYRNVYCVLFNLCKKKSMQLKLFLYPTNLRARSHFAEPAWLSSRCDWSIAMTFILTCKRHWPVVYASNLQHISLAQSRLLRIKPHGVVLRVLVTHSFSASCRSEFDCFHNHLFEQNMKSYAILSYCRLKLVERISLVFSIIVEKIVLFLSV